MKNSDSPKVVLNEDYVDLREDRKKNKPPSKISSAVKNKNISQIKQSVTNEEHYSGKEMCHDVKNVAQYSTGKTQAKLNRMTKTKNSNKEQYDSRFRRHVDPTRTLSSHSECTMCTDMKTNIIKNCSSPTFNEVPASTTHVEKESKTVTDVELSETMEKGTMTDYSPPEVVLSGEIIDIENTLLSKEPRTSIGWPDPRILEKYPSVLKLQKYRRSFTEPLIELSSQTIDLAKRTGKTIDNRDKISTYVYDEGSDVDSTVLTKVPMKPIDLTQYGKVVLAFTGSLCGIFLVSAFLWVLMDRDIRKKIFIRLTRKQEEENFLNRALKYISKGVLSAIGTVFMALYRIMTIPTGEALGHTNVP